MKLLTDGIEDSGNSSKMEHSSTVLSGRVWTSGINASDKARGNLGALQDHGFKKKSLKTIR